MLVLTVGIESDPDQSRQTAALIPTLPPVNLAEMVILWEELNCRLSRSDAFAKREEGHFSCFISENQMKDRKEGCKCSECGEATICGLCLSDLTEGAPKCPPCARRKGPEKSIASEECEAPAA